MKCGHCGQEKPPSIKYHDGTPFCQSCGNKVLNALHHIVDMETAGEEPAASELVVLQDWKLVAAFDAEYGGGKEPHK